ncbi:retrotransposon protein, putative, ty1-copia subclass [Tanacetum coccineum]
MHNMRKTIGELHALLIEYEKDLPKKAATPQLLAIQGGRIQKPNKKPQVAKGKGKIKGKVLKFVNTTQLTPLCTPQHNGVSERRNRTLLDMVGSMMNLTTLPLSFWDYALESATRLLNIVPTKKFDKTPYELWTHRAPGRLCLNVEFEEYRLGDLNEPTNYKAALSYLEYDKWLDVMNAEMQSMKDNQV